jgi:Zn-dependent protease
MFSGGIRLCRLFGTEIFLHPLWFLLLAIFALPHIIEGDILAAGVMILFLVILYASVIGHEFAHIFAGRWYGIQTKKVIINFFGGAAMMDRIPFGIPETFIGMMGPAFSFTLGTLLTLPFLLGVSYTNPVLAFAFHVGQINLMLGLFNILPIFPMDGGRMLRGILFHLNRKIVLSTKIVMIVGLCTIPLAFLTLLPYNLFTIIIMCLIVKMCIDEYQMVKVVYGGVDNPNQLDPLRVSQCTALIYVLGPDAKEVKEFRQQHSNPEFDRVIEDTITGWNQLDPLEKRKLQIDTLCTTLCQNDSDMAAQMARTIKLPGVGDE